MLSPKEQIPKKPWGINSQVKGTVIGRTSGESFDATKGETTGYSNSVGNLSGKRTEEGYVFAYLSSVLFCVELAS